MLLLSTLALLAAAAPALARRRLSPPLGHEVQPVLTTANLSRALTKMPPRRFGPAENLATQVIDVDDAVRYQRVKGFGAAMTDTSAWLIHDELAPGARAALLRRLFGKSGIALSFLRIPMGGSDFTVLGQPYTYDDVPPGDSDPQLLRFSIAHDNPYILPTLRQVLRVNPGVWTLATPWSPPAWMKANDALGNAGNEGSLLASAYGPLARYFVEFIKAYAERGVPIAAVTPQNEPQDATLYAGLNLPAPVESDWITSHLAPALRRAGLRTAVYGGDRGASLAYAETLAGGHARSSLGGIAWHCYGGLQVMSALHALDPSIDQMVSECAPGIIPYGPAEAAISAIRNWATAVALWNLALDPAGGPVQAPNSACSGCTGVVTVSEQTHGATMGLAYYQLGQLSRFVEPGAVRIRSTRLVSDFRTAIGDYGVIPGLDDVAFLNPDGSRVLVVYDNAPVRAQFAVRWRGAIFRYTLAPRATATFIWR